MVEFSARIVRRIIRPAFFIVLLATIAPFSGGDSVAQSTAAPGIAANAGASGKGSATSKIRFFDVRVSAPASAARLRSGQVLSSASLSQRVAASDEALGALRKTAPRAEVRFSPFTAAPEIVSGNGAPLSEAAPGVSGGELVKRFVGTHAKLYGLSNSDIDSLHVLGESLSPSGLRMVRVEQRMGGKRIFLSESRFLLDRQGRVHRSLGTLVPGVVAAASAASAGQTLSAEEAVSSVLNSVDVDIAASDLRRRSVEAAGRNPERVVLASSDSRLAGDVSTELGYFALRPGVLLPAWRVVAFTNTDADWYAYVDAGSGAVLWRKNIRENVSTHNARFRVYVQADGITPADSPAPASPNTVAPGDGTQFPGIAPSIVSMQTAQILAASPNGWIDDCPGGVCTADQTQTLGNNTLTCMDRTGGAGATNVCDTDADSMLDGNGRPTGNLDTAARNRDFLGASPRDFQTGFLPPPQGGNPEAGQTATGTGAVLDSFRRGVVTNLFYVTNWYHDQVFGLGFDEAAGNFQQTNFSGMGMGGDRVLGDVQDNSSTNNANFSTPPDGVSGRMQMFRFNGPDIDRDSSLDAEIVIHELTHGLSNRLVGNAAGLNWDPARGLGEGWSDFYALSLLNNTNADDPDDQYASGSYSTYKAFGITSFTDNYVYGIRRFPYSTDNTVNPLTWADVDDVTNDLGGGIATSPIDFNFGGGMEVHNSGELWANSLWEVRSRIIADPAGANGSVPTGNLTALQLVTDGMKMTPNDPTFVQARDAILDADCISNACANETSIWDGFADRGLGYGALTPYNVLFGFGAGHMAVSESFSTPFLDVADLNADVVVNDSAGNNNGAIDPGETVLLTIFLTNPFRGASKTATAGLAVLATSTPGVTILDGVSNYPNIPALGRAAGDTFQLQFAPGQTCGSGIDLVLNTDSTIGVGTRRLKLRVGTRNGTDPAVIYTKTAALAIPDGTPRGVFNTLTVTDDREIADLNYRLNSITHPFTGDLSAMLRSPNGIGVDYMSLIGGLAADFGSGDNVTNMLIDDDLPITAANDMAQAVAAEAPFTRSWLPVFNAPGVPGEFGVPPDPVGNLSRFDGLSTRGDWSTLVSDQFQVDTGMLNSWSMIVTPRHFDCAALPPPPGGDDCDGMTPTNGCTVNGVANRVCQGTSGADTIVGTNARNVILGGRGNDTIDGRGGNDLLCGGEHNDTLRGKDGNDELIGGPGNDRLEGGNGNDDLKGNDGVDDLNGGDGNDRLVGGRGRDTCKGDAGTDTARECETKRGVP